MYKNICAYVRLSNEDNGCVLGENSVSINNQIDIIKKYAQKNGWYLNKIYIDDGYSGGNFNRPNFEKLINDVESGEISTIIVKDLSRLGREMFETYYYISEYFPKKDVRFIAINDNFDTENSDNMLSDIILGFKTLYNDRFIKQTSTKIKNIKKFKSEKGNYSGFIAPYGYKKVRKNELVTLEIDEVASKVIKRIFSEVASGKKINDVAEELNNEKILYPIEYLNMKRASGKKYCEKWDYNIIYRIVRNIIYTGNIYYRKTIKNDYRLKKREFIKPSERQIIKNTHSAIIDERTFNLANEKIKRVVKGKSRIEKYKGDFKNLIFCGKCGKQMLLASRKRESGNTYFYFYCPSAYSKNKSTACTNKRKKSDLVLKELVINSINKIINNIVESEKIAENISKNVKKDVNISSEIVNIKKTLKILKEDVRNLYTEKVKGIISTEEFLTKKNYVYTNIENYNLRLDELYCIQENRIKKEELVKKCQKFLKSDEMYKMAINDLIEKLYILKDNQIVIKFKFSINKDFIIND